VSIIQRVLHECVSDIWACRIVRLPINRLGVWSTASEWVAVALLGQEHSPQLPWQKALFRLQPAVNCR